MENASADGQECVQRRGWHGEKGLPGRWLAEYGFCLRCQTYGASAHGDIYCRPKGGKPLPEGWDETIIKLAREAPDEEERKKPLAARCEMPPRPASVGGPTGLPLEDGPGAKSGDNASDGKAPGKSGGCKCEAAGSGGATTGAGALVGGALVFVALRLRRRSVG